jgi:hypothetical protein
VIALPTGATAGGVYLALFAVALMLGPLLSARFWPWRRCWRCRGRGRLYSPSRRGWRVCPRCDETGIGRRVGAPR